MRPTHPRMRTAEAFSLAVAGVGATLWVLAFVILQGQAGQILQAGTLLTSLGFVFFATQLMIVGVAFYAYSMSRKSRNEEEEAEFTLDRLETLLAKPKGTTAGSSSPIRLDVDTLNELQSRGSLSKIHVVAAVEALVVLLLYGWLVDEFNSNPYMQDWVLSNMAWAHYALNFVSVALVSGLFVGVLISQLLPALKAHRRVN